MSQNIDKKQTVTIIAPKDLRGVQGATEPFYVIRELSKEHQVHLFAYSDPDIDGVEFHQLNNWAGPAHLGLNLFQLPEFIKHLRRTRTDILYTYSGLHIGSLLATRLSGCTWIADFQTPPTGQSREFRTVEGSQSTVRKFYYDTVDLFYSLCLPCADGIITLSEGIQDELVRDYNVPADIISVVPLGVDLEKFNPNLYNSQSTSPPYDCVYLGSITGFRGIDLVLDAIGHSEKLRNELRFHIIGDGPEDAILELQQHADDLGISDLVEWHGRIDHSDVPRYLSRMDLAVSPLPALQSFKVSSPAKIFEYLAMGLPVVCSDIEAHRNILTPNVTGYFYQPEYIQELSDNLSTVTDLLSEEGKYVKSRVREHAEDHGWENRVSTISSTFN